MSALPAWAREYLALLGQSERPPSFEYLAELCTAQLGRIPFENITKLASWAERAPLPPLDEWVRRVRDEDHGGTCFLHNKSLHQLLVALGFGAHLVRLDPNPKVAPHLAILVRVPELGDEHLYVDCGSISPIFRPLRFERDVVDSASFGVEKVSIERENDHSYAFVRTVAGAVVQDDWLFDPRVPLSDEEFERMTLTEPGSHSMTMLRCQVWDIEGKRSLSLVNCMFTIRHADGRNEVMPLSTEQDILDVIATHFQRPGLPTSKAIEVLRGLGVDALKPRFEFARRPRRPPPPNR